ncbi:MAG: phosphotransferase [Aequorivita sp.]
MEIHIIKKLQEVERLSEVNFDSNKLLTPYRCFNQIWIKADKPVMEIYATTLKNSELQFYTSKNLKAWAIYVLNRLKGKKKQSLKNLLGIKMVWRFLEIVDLRLHADIIYFRQHAVVMVYNKEKRVIKVALTQRGKRDMANEVESQNLASSIACENVYIPSIIQEFHKDDIDFTVEEYFEGKRQSFKNRGLLEANYYKVFQFLLKFYLSAPIELEVLSESKFLNHEFVEEFISKQAHGNEIISIFKKLYAKEKRMIRCRIHGDLNHNNVLYEGDRVCIIDWGGSKHHYLFSDLDNASFDTQVVFEQFIELSKIDTERVYPYYEQLFLEIFIEMCRWIHNGIQRKTIGPGFYKWIDIKGKRLLEISEKF